MDEREGSRAFVVFVEAVVAAVNKVDAVKIISLYM